MMAAKGNFRVFVTIWFGQLVSQMGSRITGFAMGIWAYSQTGSVAQYALISFFAILPDLALAPLIGVLVDRFDRRRLMLLGNCLTAVLTMAVALLFFFARLEVWHLYPLVALRAICYSCVGPAYSSSIAMLVKKRNLGRASGIANGADAFAQIFSPALAGALFGFIGLSGILLIDFSTFVIAIFTLLPVRIPRPPKPELEAKPFFQDAFFGCRYIWRRPDLRMLLALSMLTVLCLDTAGVLVTPLVLSFSTPQQLGVIVSTGGAGMLLGSVVMAAWGGPRRQVFAMLGFRILGGAFIAAAGLTKSLPLLATVAFGCYFCFSLSGAAGQTIWRREVEPHLQGRVFAITRTAIMAIMPIAILGGGFLAEYVFEPMLLSPLAGIDQLVGSGPGRGTALLFVIAGVTMMLSAAAGFFHRPLYRIDITALI